MIESLRRAIRAAALPRRCHGAVQQQLLTVLNRNHGLSGFPSSLRAPRPLLALSLSFTALTDFRCRPSPFGPPPELLILFSILIRPYERLLFSPGAIPNWKSCQSGLAEAGQAAN